MYTYKYQDCGQGYEVRLCIALKEGGRRRERGEERESLVPMDENVNLLFKKNGNSK